MKLFVAEQYKFNVGVYAYKNLIHFTKKVRFHLNGLISGLIR